MRGDNCQPELFTAHNDGSPPHARGQPVGVPSPGLPRRFTPACAGTTSRQHRASSPQPVHPRMRGDNRSRRLTSSRRCGSPPHARGQQRGHPEYEQRVRFTPACAGTTQYGWFRQPHSPVHPRMRGDNPIPPIRIQAAHGSPPHARGQRHEPPTLRKRERFTPACAGTTGVEPGDARPPAVHPRMRGDNSVSASERSRPSGSPPHARGQLVCTREGFRCRRFTPACAGTTIALSSPSQSRSVHPRMRGDNSVVPSSSNTSRGSPPHARGQLCPVVASRGVARFTPACAGTTRPE